MKKIFLISALACLSLCSCDFSFNESGGEIVSNLTQLPSPNIVEVVNDYVFWDEVPNASSYVVKINNYQESTGNQLKYSISSIMDSRVDYNVPTDLHIYVKAKGNQVLYSDSEWSNEYVYTYTKVKNDSIKLDTPILSEYKNNTISWNPVSNAVGYELLINNSELRTTAYNFYEITEFDSTCDFTFQVRALASKGSNYIDSDWTAIDTKKYIQEDQNVNEDWTSIFIANGIGQSVNALRDRYIEPASGAETIFNESELFDLKLTENTISSQEAKSYSKNSISDMADKWNAEISFKIHKGLNGNKVNPKNYGKGFGYKFEAAANYSNFKTSKTTELYFTLTQVVTAKRVEIAGYKNTEKLTNILSDQFLSDAKSVQDNLNTPEWLINRYGTHIITSGYYGGKIEATYTLLSNSESFNRETAANISLELNNNLTFVTSRNISTDLKVENEYLKNTSDVKTSFDVKCLGGKARAFGTIEEFAKNYSNWIETVDDNTTLIDVPDNSLISIWSLLPNEYDDLKTTMDNYYNEENEKHYNDFLSQFPNTLRGDGTAESPYLISTPSDLNSLRNYTDEKYYFKITNDIDMQNMKWKTIDSFQGYLDGCGFAIKNLNVTSTTQLMTNASESSKITTYASFIGINEGNIENLVIDTAKIDVTYSEFTSSVRMLHCSALVGYNNGIVRYITISNSIIDGVIDKSETTGEVYPQGRIYCGAIVGRNNNEIEFVKVENTTIIAFSNAMNNKCENYSFAGGIVGYCNSSSEVHNGIVRDCYVSSTCKGGYYLFLQGGGSIKACAGYIIGKNNGNASYCITYDNKINSLISETIDLDNYMSVTKLKGFIFGQIDGGTLSHCYCVDNGIDCNVVGGTTSYENYKLKDNDALTEKIQDWDDWFKI